MISPEPMCVDCVHFDRDDGNPGDVRWPRCKAFPSGIPREIFFDYYNHADAFPGDNGIQFESFINQKQNENTCHNPAGTENGGQFCSGSGSGAGNLGNAISVALKEDPRRMFHGYMKKKGKPLTTSDTGFWIDADGNAYVHKKIGDVPEEKRNDLINVHSHGGQDSEAYFMQNKDVPDFSGVESFSGGDFQMLQYNIRNGFGTKMAVLVAPDEYDYFEVPEAAIGKFIRIKKIADEFTLKSTDLAGSREHIKKLADKYGFIFKPGQKLDGSTANADKKADVPVDNTAKPFKKIPGIKPGWQIIAREALKYDNFDDYENAWFRQYYGKYWHITDDPNFKIDPTKGPRDMSSMGGKSAEAGKLMVSAIPEHWIDTYPNRKYIAEIDLSDVPKDKYWDVSRGFGHEIWVDDPSRARVTKVWPVASGLRAYNRYFKALPQSEAELRSLYDTAHANKNKQKQDARGKCKKKFV